MKIIRYKSKEHVTINNAIMFEKELSLKAKGLFSLVMSLPDNWDFSVVGICAITKENECAIRAAIDELIKAGYCSRDRVREDGKYVACRYEFYEKKSRSPRLENPHVENPRVENLDDKYNSSINTPINNNENISTINSPDNNKESKSLSNDKQKSDESFNILWSKYKKGSKQNAINQWNKLKDKEKELVLNTVDDYITYCRRSNRPLKDVSAYLHQKCFNDDWNVIPEYYLIREGDDARCQRFKGWMCSKFKDLLYHRNPLTYEQAQELFDEYPVSSIRKAMEKLSSRDIHQYYNIKSGIEKILESDEL